MNIAERITILRELANSSRRAAEVTIDVDYQKRLLTLVIKLEERIGRLEKDSANGHARG